MLQKLESDSLNEVNFPFTDLYNESWLLRLVLDCLEGNPEVNSPLKFLDNARWFSEAYLPPPFLARFRKDKLAETHTHADGTIGHFSIGGTGKTDLVLDKAARQFVVLEAKMFSSLSKGIRADGDYDQAARTVACMCEIMSRARKDPNDIEILAHYVIAPRKQINRGVFHKHMNSQSIFDKVKRRVDAYKGDKDEWFHQAFVPAIKHFKIDCISWEDTIGSLNLDNQTHSALRKFYQECLKNSSSN
jgi:hypothetical protein